MNTFSLQPFPTESILPQIEIHGSVERSQDLLSIKYQLCGDLNSVSISPPANPPSRKFHLWETTCLEFFLGVPGTLNYWEFNLSPSGDWNVFYLDDYRQGLRNEPAFVSLPLTIDRQANSLVLTLAFDLSKIIPLDRDLEIAVTAVIKSSQADLSYWALTHLGTVADFHRRDSFMIKI